MENSDEIDFDGILQQNDFEKFVDAYDKCSESFR